MSWMWMKRYRLSVSEFPLGKQKVSCQIETHRKNVHCVSTPPLSLLLQAVANSIYKCLKSRSEKVPPNSRESLIRHPWMEGSHLGLYPVHFLHIPIPQSFPPSVL